MDNENFFKASDLAKKLDVNIMTIYRYIAKKKLKAYKIGKEYRIDNVDYEAFLKRVSTQ